MTKKVLKKAVKKAKADNNYFLDHEKDVSFIPSGCTTLDMVLGGGWALGRMANIVGDRSSGKCGRDFYINTPQGMLYIDDVGEAMPEGATPWDMTLALDRGGPSQCTHFYKERVNKTYKIRTKHGFEFIATPDHKLRVWRSDTEFEMRAMKDIAVGDVMVIALGTRMFPEGYATCDDGRHVTEDMGALLGLLTHNHGAPDTALRLATSVFGTPVKEKEVAYDMLRDAVGDFTSVVPAVVLVSPKTVQASYLESLLNAERTLLPTHRMARQVQLMAANFGMLVEISPASSEVDTPWQVYVDADWGWERFYDHSDTFAGEGYYYDEVVSKEEILGPQDVYDVHVPDGHLFWANGFVSHNTLLAIEACANFANMYDGPIYYREAEAAFDQGYAAALGMPIDRIDFGEDFHTVEDFYEDLNEILKAAPDDQPALYIVDSLDALSDRDELSREIDKGSYGAAKAKKLSELFRRLVRQIEKKQVSLIIISQVRDNINAMFGSKHTRSGGRAIDFYASQIIWLHHMGMLKRTVKKLERPYGAKVRAKCSKNKVGMPYRECDFEIHFGYGIDDLSACLHWLKQVDLLGEAGFDMTERQLTTRIRNADDEEYDKMARRARKAVLKHWPLIEQQFMPTRKKYG